MLVKFLLTFCIFCGFLWFPAYAQDRYQATLTIRTDQPRWTINRNVYGQFAEHLGRLIYEGLWVGEGSAIPNTRGLRNVHVSLVNLDPNKAMEITAIVWGSTINTVTGEVLTAPTMNAMNTFDRPNVVTPARFSAFKVQGSQITLNMPPKSVYWSSSNVAYPR